MLEFAADANRHLIDTTGTFAIWTKGGPDYYLGAIVGRADGRPLYEFGLETVRKDSVVQATLGRGRREHVFDEWLIGKTRPLLEAAIPAIIRLPEILEWRQGGEPVVLLGPDNLIEQTLYTRSELTPGPLVEIARIEAG